MGEEIDEVVRTLARRRDFIEALLERPMEKPALAEELDVARSTVDRGLRDLEVVGFVHRTDEGYEPTASGRAAFREFDRFADAVSGVQEATEITSSLPSSELVDFSTDLFVDAEVTAATVHDPDRPLREAVDLVADATAVRGFSPSAHTAYVDVFHERVVEAGMETELVFSPAALDALTDTHLERLCEATDTGVVELYRIDDLPPVGLILVDDRESGGPEVCVVVYTDSGVTGVVRNDTDAALEWADETYCRVRERAERVPL